MHEDAMLNSYVRYWPSMVCLLVRHVTYVQLLTGYTLTYWRKTQETFFSFSNFVLCTFAKQKTCFLKKIFFPLDPLPPPTMRATWVAFFVLSFGCKLPVVLKLLISYFNFCKKNTGLRPRVKKFAL